MLRSIVHRLNSSLRKFLTVLMFGYDRVGDRQYQQPDSSYSSTNFTRLIQSPGTVPAQPIVNKAINGKHSSFTTSLSTIKHHQQEQCAGKMSVMESGIMLDRMEDALSCPVCLEEFKKMPKILPTCGHSFCLPCIEHWYEFSGGMETGILRCPVCKSKTNLRILKYGARCFKKRSNFLGGKSNSNSEKSHLPPPPLPSSLRNLLSDSPVVDAVLKIQKRLCKHSRYSTNLESVMGDLRGLLTCQSCQFRLEEPRMLPACRHSFCTGCLQKLYKPSSSIDKTGHVATIVCPICSTLYRFNYQQSSSTNTNSTSPSSPPNSKSISTDEKKSNESIAPQPPPKEKLATYLPFDYVLGCLLDAIPEKL